MRKEDYIISMTDEQGMEKWFEILGFCDYEDGEYLILLPQTEEDPTSPEIMRIEGEGEHEYYVVEPDPYKRADILNTFCIQQQRDVHPCGAEVVYPPEMKFLRPTRGWLGILLFFLRSCLPILTLLLVMPYIDTLYVRQLSEMIAPSALQLLVYAGHMVAVGWGMNANLWLGWRYEGSAGLLPLACCMLLFFAQYHFNAAVCIVGVLLVGALFLILSRHKHAAWIERHSSFAKWITTDAAYSKSAGRIFDSLLSVAIRRYLAVGFVMLMLIPAAYTCLKYGLDPIVYRAENALSPEVFENDYHFFDQFLEENWALMTTEKKVNALQGIAYLEADRLNIDDVYVHAEEIDDGRLGYHISNTRDIYIDLTHKEHQDPMKCIHTILHECRHVYQNDCISSMNWASPQVQSGIYYENVREWRYNLDNYRSVSNGDEYEAYYNQPVEKDAREYADRAIGIYESIMMQYKENYQRE